MNLNFLVLFNATAKKEENLAPLCSVILPHKLHFTMTDFSSLVAIPLRLLLCLTISISFFFVLVIIFFTLRYITSIIMFPGIISRNLIFMLTQNKLHCNECGTKSSSTFGSSVSHLVHISI